MPNKKLTHDEFLHRINEKYPNKYEFLEEYQGMQKTIKTKYLECGHIGYPTPGNLLNFGRGCPKCSTRKKSHEEFVKDVNERYPGQYEFLSEYNGADKPIHTRDLVCGLEWWPTAASIYANNIRHPDYVKTREYKLSIGDKNIITQEEFEKRFFDIAGSDYKPLEEYRGTTQNIRIKHKCGFEFSRRVSSIFYGGGCYCPMCYPDHCNGVVVGVNDIHSTNSYLESILKDPTDAYKYSQFSHEKTWFICPICGEKLYKKIATVSTCGLSCYSCGSGISFGEKYMINFFRYFSQEYEFQFSPKWIGLRRYDFQFDRENIKYILEVDGGWHDEDNNLSGVTAEEQREIDNYKNQEAINHGYVVIRLDYKYNKVTNNKEKYLINSILNSELATLFDINLDILDEILMITKSKELIPDHVYKIAKVWNSLSDKNMRNLKIHYSLNEDGLRKYLYKASELGLINESKDEIILLNRKSQFTNGKDTRAHYAICDQTGEILNYSEAREKYRANLFRYFQNKNYIHTGKLPDGTKLTWHKVKNVA